MKASGRALSLETPGSPAPLGAALPAAMSFVLVGSTQSSPGQQAAVAYRLLGLRLVLRHKSGQELCFGSRANPPTHLGCTG